MEKGSGGRLIVDSVSNIGPRYARTLREWRRRFVSRFESVIVPALKAEHSSLKNDLRGKEEIYVFHRKWSLDTKGRRVASPAHGSLAAVIVKLKWHTRPNHHFQT